MMLVVCHAGIGGARPSPSPIRSGLAGICSSSRTHQPRHLRTEFRSGDRPFSLLAAPLFILVGNIMNESGITRKIFRFANSIVGCLPGWLWAT
jgi:hypothetical protein